MRVQVTLNDDFGEKVDSYASKFGLSRSALCAMLVGLGIASFETAFSNMDKRLQEQFQTELNEPK